MSAKTADDLGRYVAWAAAAADADEQDAMTLTMDRALGQFFQRDKLFKERGEDRTDASGANVESSIKSAQPPMAPVARTHQLAPRSFVRHLLRRDEHALRAESEAADSANIARCPQRVHW